MLEVYVKLIINKMRTIDQVPDNFKNDVKARLTELGYNDEGEPIVAGP